MVLEINYWVLNFSSSSGCCNNCTCVVSDILLLDWCLHFSNSCSYCFIHQGCVLDFNGLNHLNNLSLIDFNSLIPLCNAWLDHFNNSSGSVSLILNTNLRLYLDLLLNGLSCYISDNHCRLSHILSLNFCDNYCLII